MTTITEDYVSFETAKLLKEKGFPQNPNICNTAYTFRGKLSNNAKSFAHNFTEFNKCGIKPISYSMAPTLQMAMKWLREVHRLFICVEIGVGAYAWNITNTTDYVIVYVDATVGTYEQACDAAIQYCLKHLI